MKIEIFWDIQKINLNNLFYYIILTNKMNIDESTLISYVKQNYPKIVFSPLKLKTDGSKSHSLGFIVSDNKLVIGYLNNNGNLCKLIEPVDLSTVSHTQFMELVNKIPLVSGFNEEDKQILLNILHDKNSVSRQEHDAVIIELKESFLKQEESKFTTLIDVTNKKHENEILLIKKAHVNEIEDIKDAYNKEIEALKNQLQEVEEVKEKCKQRLLSEKEQIIKGIQSFREQISNYISEIMVSKNNQSNQKLNDMYTQLLKEKSDINNSLAILTEREKQNLQTIQDNQSQMSEFTSKLNAKEQEIDNLNNTIQQIQEELNKVQKQFSEKELEDAVLREFKKNCIEMILNQKEQIIEKIKQYNSQWLEWVDKNQFDIDSQKDKLQNDLNTIFANLKKVLYSKNEYIDSLNLSIKEKDSLLNQLKSNVSDIKAEVNASLNEQLMQLSVKNQELESTISSHSEELKKKDKTIAGLREQLDEAKKLLEKNAVVVIPKEIDYTSCHETLQKFINVNNMFYRKKQVMSILDGIINNADKISNFTNLNDAMKDNIRTRFENVKTEINKHIEFLDLGKYINSPNIQLFKSKTTMKNIPPQFCDELNNISNYWDNNVGMFREQDRILTNIYEDLSGAVRVYIKIKPLIGKEQKHNTVYIEKHTKKVTVDCSEVANVNKKQTFGDFYGIFNDTYTNKDVYTGIQGSGDIYDLHVDIDSIEESTETVSPGLYSTFKQVEDGYSIVLFGYGLSGSGKTFSLIGDKGIPGLLHYGLSNLRGVSKIRLKYLFEQYIDKFVPTINKIRGNIINLVNEIPQLKNYSKNEQKEFGIFINDKLNLNDIKVDNINTLTTLLETYRKSHSRIKKTPNNPVSSRSHLYMVFEVQFETGKVGYITIVDTAGRESPIDIYNMFIDTSQRIDLTTILGPTGSPDVVKRFMNPRYKDYNHRDVYEILNEGVYINETINHLIYFFNKKNYRTTRIQKQLSLETYANEKYYVDPKKEEDGVASINNCLMIPILKFLDAISNKKLNESDYKPTKFITLVCVRKDEEYCSQIFGSLDFAEKIKSS